MSEPVVRRHAPAKINLYLHVTGKRADGYHSLDSLVVFARLGDRLAMRPAERLGLEVVGPFASAVPAGADNLVVRAARSLAGLAGVEARAAIVLEKKLPVAAGLGGGSADAAAALRGLAELWRLPVGERELLDLGLSLGADVPACLIGRPAQVGGIGEAVMPVSPLPHVDLVLVNPGPPAPTAQVFAAFQGPMSAPAGLGEVPPTLADVVQVLAARGNDLEAPARALVPAIAEVLDALWAQSGCLLARMSGSGPTCFGIFADGAAAARAAAAIASQRPHWWCAVSALAAAERRAGRQATSRAMAN